MLIIKLDLIMIFYYQDIIQNIVKYSNLVNCKNVRLLNRKISIFVTNILYFDFYFNINFFNNLFNIKPKKLIVREKINIPNSVTHLTFGYCYNQITNIPNSVTHLTFGDDYDQITNIPNSVTHLTFRHC